jgi:hypothetical protein
MHFIARVSLSLLILVIIITCMHVSCLDSRETCVLVSKTKQLYKLNRVCYQVQWPIQQQNIGRVKPKSCDINLNE